jgi:cytochrome c-type biogenesis protein CcmH/NrfG
MTCIVARTRRLAPLLIAGLLCSAPALAQESGGGVDEASESALLLQRNATLAQQALSARVFREARQYAQSVTRGAPKRIEGWLMLGAAQTGLEDWKAAGATYRTAVRLAPVNADAHTGLGVALAHNGDAAAAEQVAWLTTTARTCSTNCAALARQKSDVEAAIAAAAKGR